MKVLVIEDDVAVRETLGMVLEAFHHEPALVENGEQALEHLKKNWPDALLLDLTLEETTGEQVYEQIRKVFGRIPPTVVLSAVQHGEARAQQMTGVLYLAKPYTIEDLVDILDEVVKKIPGAA